MARPTGPLLLQRRLGAQSGCCHRPWMCRSAGVASSLLRKGAVLAVCVCRSGWVASSLLRKGGRSGRVRVQEWVGGLQPPSERWPFWPCAGVRGWLPASFGKVPFWPGGCAGVRGWLPASFGKVPFWPGVQECGGGFQPPSERCRSGRVCRSAGVASWWRPTVLLHTLRLHRTRRPGL